MEGKELMNVLTEADQIVNGPRRKTYGEPHENHGCTADLWRVYLKRRFGMNLALDGYDVCWMNVLQKGSRDAHLRKRDNLRDGCGFLRNAEIIDEGSIEDAST